MPIKLRVNQRESKLVYSIAVHYGPKRLEAVLDTGSMPPLVLKGRVPAHDAQPTGATYSITYGVDRSYVSNVVQGPVRIGSESGTIAFGIVSSVSCVPQGSTCPIFGRRAARRALRRPLPRHRRRAHHDGERRKASRMRSRWRISGTRSPARQAPAPPWKGNGDRF